MKLTLKNSPTTHFCDALRTNWNGPCRLALICALLMAFAAAPLHAQLTYKDLWDFACSIGCSPVDYGQLTPGPDGNLYGTTQSGGSGAGTIFNVSTNGSYTPLYIFSGGTDGAFPLGGLTAVYDSSSGATIFYGTTSAGGDPSSLGTLFSYNPSAVPPFTTLHVFNGTDGQFPATPPTAGPDGNLYGVTGSGTTYRYCLMSPCPKGGPFTQLPHSVLSGTTSPLYLADGLLYGTTESGGTSGDGTVFYMTPTVAGTIGPNKPISFNGTNGSSPQGPLTQGNLYGVTKFGGANNNGTIFYVNVHNQIVTMYNFSPLAGGTNDDGANPVAGLLASGDGYLYGTTTIGGAFGYGTIFRIPTSAPFTFTKLIDFTGAAGSGIPGANTDTTLLLNTDSLFYGLSQGAVGFGSGGTGSFYALSPQSGGPHILIMEGPVWLAPGVTVEILGDGLTGAASVSFAGVPAQFQPGSNTYLIAQVPSAAVDGLITVTLATGAQVESQVAMHILPIITNLDPPSGAVGTQVGIVGGGFAGAKKVTFGGVKATSFTVNSPTLILATVPAGAKTGKVKVTTPNGTATSKEKFTVN
ncbi:MAG: choice-of-anchor tandem repeat GloVer-containing protein [Terriglobales bacterium]